MFKSDAERLVRKAIEENGAEFTEEQIKAISQMILSIATTMIEEAFANWSPSSGGGKRGY